MPLEAEGSSTTAVSPPAGDANRRLSLPDLTKLKEEWDRREAIQATAQLSPGKLQVSTILQIHIDRYTNKYFT
jgi:hemolysin activation/secretion protein